MSKEPFVRVRPPSLFPFLSLSPVQADPHAEEDEREDEEDGEDADERDLQRGEERPAKTFRPFIPARCFFHAYKSIGANERRDFA